MRVLYENESGRERLEIDASPAELSALDPEGPLVSALVGALAVLPMSAGEGRTSEGKASASAEAVSAFIRNAFLRRLVKAGSQGESDAIGAEAREALEQGYLSIADFEKVRVACLPPAIEEPKRERLTHETIAAMHQEGIRAAKGVDEIRAIMKSAARDKKAGKITEAEYENLALEAREEWSRISEGQ